MKKHWMNILMTFLFIGMLLEKTAYSSFFHFLSYLGFLAAGIFFLLLCLAGVPKMRDKYPFLVTLSKKVGASIEKFVKSKGKYSRIKADEEHALVETKDVMKMYVSVFVFTAWIFLFFGTIICVADHKTIFNYACQYFLNITDMEVLTITWSYIFILFVGQNAVFKNMMLNKDFQ